MKKILYICIVLVGFSACTDKFDELNIDPNRPVQATSQSILLSTQRSITHTLLDDNNPFEVLRWTQYHGRQGYAAQPFPFDWNTDAFYNNITYQLNNLELLRKQAIADGHVNFEAVAMIMKAWIFSNATDMYGDIPYSEALQGANNYYPKFDSQESIYKDLVLKLKEAEAKIVTIAQVADIDGGSDIFCQGDMMKWRKFANALRARLYMRMSEVAGTIAKDGLEEIFGNPSVYPILDSNDDNVGVAFIEDTNGANTATFVQQSDAGNIRPVGTAIVDLLCANDDPRRKVMLNATKNSREAVANGTSTFYQYTGGPAAIEDENVSFEIDELSTVGDAIALDYFRPMDVITYAEVKFIQAEAAAKGYSVGGTAEMLYNQGIEASMTKWGVSDASAITAYIAKPAIAFNATTAKEQIITQRYIEQFHQGLNTFAMIRRAGFPRLDWISLGFANDYGYPDRLPYATNIFGNPNVQDVLSQVTQAIWGEVWFGSQTNVQTAASYQAPTVYNFTDN